MARERGESLPQLVARIDEDRETPNLSSALRVAVLVWLKARAARS